METLSPIPERHPVRAKVMDGDEDRGDSDNDSNDDERESTISDVVDGQGKKSSTSEKRRKKMKAPLRQVSTMFIVCGVVMGIYVCTLHKFNHSL